MDRTSPADPIDIADLPELPTAIGMPGALIEVEVGGHVCLDSGVLIITSLV